MSFYSTKSKQSRAFLNAATYLYNLAKEANTRGDYFPVWGTCLGFEMMLVIEAGNNCSILSSGYKHYNITEPVKSIDLDHSKIYKTFSVKTL